MNILVNFRVEDGKTKKAKPVIQRVTTEYIGGQVGTHTGDCFRAKMLPVGSVVEIKGRRVPVHMVALN